MGVIISIECYEDFKEVMLYELKNYPGYNVLRFFEKPMYTTNYIGGSQVTAPNGTSAYALIARPAEQREVTRHLDAAKQCTHEAMRQRDEVAKQLKDTSEVVRQKGYAIESLKDQLRLSNDQAKTLSDQVNPLQAQVRKMEVDLSRVREAIGSIEFAKIVGPAKA